MFGWGFVFLLLLVWVFTLGVLAGRGSLPGDLAVTELKEQVAKIQEIIRRNGPREAGQADDPPPESPRLSFYEKLTIKKDESRAMEDSRVDVDRDKISGTPGTVVARAPSRLAPGAPEKQAGPSRLEAEPSEKQPHSGSEYTKLKQEPGVEVTPPLAGREDLRMQARFTVQVAAVENRIAAEDMMGRLKRKGHPAYYYDVVIDGKRYYRVRCGRFLSRTEAEQYAAFLAEKEGIKGFVSRLE